MWYTVNASGDEFVRMRIRCSLHPVRACDVCSMHKPRRFFCSNQRTSNLKFVTGIYFQTFTVRLSPCNFTHIYLYFLEKLTFAMCSLPHMWQWLKKSFVCGYTPKIFCHWHYRRSFSVVWKFFISSRHDKLHNKKPHCVFLITVRFFDFHQVFQIKNPHQRLQKCLGTARFIKNLMKNCVLEKTYAFAENSWKIQGIVLQ